VSAKSLSIAVFLLAVVRPPHLAACDAIAFTAAPAPTLTDLPDAPAEVGTTAVIVHDRVLLRDPMRPFSDVGLSLKFGMGGVGFEVATPLGERINLRAGASFLSYNPKFVDDAMNVVGDVKFRTAQASVDYYPFGGKFRVSPGLVLYNGNHITANVVVPGGQSITFDATAYVSSTADPIITNVAASFGHKIAPSLTFGWGNLIPRDGKHWSVPFEMGFEYVGTPRIDLNVSGSACQQGSCGPITTDPTTKTNVLSEQNTLNHDIAPLRFYPIVSTGIGYRF